ncbi:hypothetical protein HDU81_004343, partial [Chytriomyces hyalinus]
MAVHAVDVRASYAYASNDLASFDFTGVNTVNMAFASFSSGGIIKLPSDYNKLFVANCHKANVRAVLSIGGWDTTPFSDVLSDSTKSSNLINSIASVVAQEKFDGVDIDWEFPGRPGAIETFRGTDTANLLSFATNLKKALKAGATVSATALAVPFYGANGQALTDLAPVAKAFDYINLMAYDMNGVWDANTGPNAPFYKVDGIEPVSFYDAVGVYASRGFPLNQLVMGIP